MKPVSPEARLCGAIYKPSGDTCSRPAGNHKLHIVSAGVRSVAWPNPNYRMSGRQLRAQEEEAKLISLVERIREHWRIADIGLDVDAADLHQDSDLRKWITGRLLTSTDR